MLYTYRATVLHVVDGDTVDLSVSLGFEMSYKARFRLIGINTPESYGPSASDEGRAAKRYLVDLLKEGTPLVVKTTKDKKEKYGRFLAELFMFDEHGQVLPLSVNQTLIGAGHAVAYFGGAR